MPPSSADSSEFSELSAGSHRGSHRDSRISTPSSAISTPSSERVSRKVTVAHSAETFSFHVSTLLYDAAIILCNEFMSSSQPTLESATEISPIHLLAAFLNFLSEKIVHQHANYQTTQRMILDIALTSFDDNFLHHNDIHTIGQGQEGNCPSNSFIVHSYLRAKYLLDRTDSPHHSNLLKAIEHGDAKLCAMFGGQGNDLNYFDEIRELYTTYQPLVESLVDSTSQLLSDLASQPEFEHHYLQGINIQDWIANPDSQPNSDYTVSAPISFPLIGLLQLMRYKATVHLLGYEPKEMHDFISGVTGHSQGIIPAVIIAAADSWARYDELSQDGIAVLANIGLFSQEAVPKITYSGVGPASQEAATCMLSIRELPVLVVEEAVKSFNREVPRNSALEVSLINGLHNVVVSGPPTSLSSLTSRLNSMKASGSQARVPFSKRLPTVSYRFLPITAPFHSSYLSDVLSAVTRKLKLMTISGSDLRIPVYSTKDGSDLRLRRQNVVPELIQMITVDQLDWPRATKFPEATHIVDFGPGGLSGVGAMTQRSIAGSGIRIILASVLESENQTLGSRGELFDRAIKQSIKLGINWAAEHAPQLVRTSTEQYVDTKMSRLLGLPPLMVAGMTPTTVSTDFVTATMKAGYHIEIAAGGYHNAESLTSAIYKIIENAPVGRGIAINLIYANPHAIRWQIPLIAQLRSEGVPIDGLTIGAGVPSLEIASQYIVDLGLKYIAFKPGSVDAIKSVIEIAKAHADFPIMLQWTGGRGGGHHSFEDFHQPMLQMYSELRTCPNIVLVAGSGFGNCESSYPYLTGEWSENFRRSRMPFDGILLGSRVMTALEAKTSLEVKQAIVDCPGLQDMSWEETYNGAHGGIVSVKSEMGEPIHKLATRAVQLWYELDNTIFSMTKPKRAEALRQKRSYIIKRLNKDFCKVWFGKNGNTGEAVDLELMTYQEVILRFVELTYVKHESRWIDPSFQRLLHDFCAAVETRYSTSSGSRFHFRSAADMNHPHNSLKEYFEAIPQLGADLISFEDAQLFVQMCRRSGQKPVPFILALDDDFEYWFKKDSLWQSEDLQAVVDQDVGRTCILQGPVSVQYCKKVNEPIKEILDDINNGYMAHLSNGRGKSGALETPDVECFGFKSIVPVDVSAADEFIVSQKCDDRLVFQISPQVDPARIDESVWRSVISGGGSDWRHALLESKTVRRGTKIVPNPAIHLFSGQPGCSISVKSGPGAAMLTYFETSADGNIVPTVEASAKDNLITLKVFEYRTCSGEPESLKLLYKFTPALGFSPLHELTADRNQRIRDFYHRIWFGKDFEDQYSIHDSFESEEFIVTSNDISKFTRSVGNSNDAYVKQAGKSLFGPLDFAVVAAWKGLMKPLFCSEIDSDLLALVHLSNSFDMLPGARPFQVNDVLTTKTRINSIINQKAGKMIEVVGQIFRGGKPILDLRSQFLYRGLYTDFENTFQHVDQEPMKVHLKLSKDSAILKSKPWFQMLDPSTKLDGCTSTFRPETFLKFQSKDIFSEVKVRGVVEIDSATGQTTKVGTIQYNAGVSHGNPVVDYLRRHGHQSGPRKLFEKAIPLFSRTALVVDTPKSNDSYGKVSGDFNPIHVSRAFAACAGLPGTIVHGMWTSAKVRSVVEKWVCMSAIGLFRSWKCTFMDMVLPETALEVKFKHIGMASGRKIIEVTAANRETGTVVLQGECEIEAPKTAYLFTGQGSQHKGMGMDLYAESEVARSVWDRADSFYWETYGFKITDIVRRDPKSLLISFGGVRGRRIRENYMALKCESIQPDGTIQSRSIFSCINEQSTSYTFAASGGLLSATQFTQPALTLMEKAIFEDMKSRGLIAADSGYAGHSLGEYSALASVAEIFSIESLIAVVFYRGLTMQLAVERDEAGNSNFSMCAVDPSRVTPSFNELALRTVCQEIAKQSNLLLEIVNYNIANKQYVCAGDLRALKCLTGVLDDLHSQRSTLPKGPFNADRPAVHKIITSHLPVIEAVQKVAPTTLKRGVATIPLSGIDVPFHSSFLQQGVAPFRRVLQRSLDKERLTSDRIEQKYVPNLTAQPFEISKSYFENVWKLTKSPLVAKVVEHWDNLQDKHTGLEVLEILKTELSAL